MGWVSRVDPLLPPEHEDQYASQWEAMGSIAANIGSSPESLRNWVRRAEVNSGRRDGVTRGRGSHEAQGVARARHDSSSVAVGPIIPSMAEQVEKEQRLDPRKQKTLFCQLAYDGKQYPAVVLDVSLSGLFVRTSLALPRSTEVEVRLGVAGGRSWKLRAEIARNPRGIACPAGLRSRGLGLRLIDPPEDYTQFIENL